MLKKVPMLCKGVKDEPDNLLDQITDQINPVNTDGHGCKFSSRFVQTDNICTKNGLA